MYIMGILKRVAPFVITFALGLFVASFFVSVAFPSLRINRGWKSHREYHRKLEFENRQLKAENCRLRKEAAERRAQWNFEAEAVTLNELVPPPPPIPVAPRPAR
jgi:uncharacterized membrane protein YgaE (UPF0421/DUF939 family)